MTEPLYLIAHKVRGEAAFDVAIQQPCSVCLANQEEDCEECGTDGYWWISNTYGHRCYPYWWSAFEGLVINAPPMPTDAREHFPIKAEPQAAKSARDRTPSLAHTLGLIKPMNRRI